MHARFVLQWLAGDLDALPLWNGGNGRARVTDGASVVRSTDEMTTVHSWALMAQWRHPWPEQPETAGHTGAYHGYARGVAQLLEWSAGATATGPLTGSVAAGLPSLYEISLDVQHAMTGLDQARSRQNEVMIGRIEGIIETFAWLAGWVADPPVDRHGHVPVETCPERLEQCDCDSAGECLTAQCRACIRAPCAHGFA